MVSVRREWVRILIEDPCEQNRSRAHAQLGHLELSSENVDKAKLHFQEAVELDPTDEQTAEVLRSLEQLHAPTQSRIGRLWSSIRGHA